MPKLIFKSADHKPLHNVELHDGTYSVGRGGDCRLIVPHNSVSTHHCDVLVHGTEVIVRDSGSKNGTFVNGVRVKGQMPVKSRQIIQFGIVPAELILPPPPFFGDDDSCESAVFDHRRYMNRPPAPELSSKDVRSLSLDQPHPREEHTIAYGPTTTMARPVVSPSPVIPHQETINLGAPVTRPVARIPSVWMYVGLGAFALLLVWLLRHSR